MDRDNLSEDDMMTLGKLLPDLDKEDDAKDPSKTILRKQDKCKLAKALATEGRVMLRAMTKQQREEAKSKFGEAARSVNFIAANSPWADFADLLFVTAL